MKPGRKATPGGYLEWKVIVPTSLAAEVELRLLDPIYNKARYGARSKLIVTLLQKWTKGEIELPLDQ